MPKHGRLDGHTLRVIEKTSGTWAWVSCCDCGWQSRSPTKEGARVAYTEHLATMRDEARVA